MLAQYRTLLDRLRQDPEAWGQLAHKRGMRSDDFDPAYRARYGVLLCLQYDLQDTDEPLVRYLFREEVAAREEDPFQGLSGGLKTAAYLLARFRRTGDLELFVRAKQANFDTGCGFDSRYLFWMGLSAAGDCGEPNLEEQLRLELEDRTSYSPAELEAWWQELQAEFRTCEAEESPLELVERALTLGAIEEGRRWLDTWEAGTVEDERSLYTLKYLRDELGQPERALEASEKLVTLAAGDPWKETSARKDVAGYLLKLERYPEAWSALTAVLDRLDRHPEWKQAGMARMAAELVMDLVATCPDRSIAESAWQRGHALMQEVTSYLNLLHKAEQAATRLGFEKLARQYGRLAETEARRIEAELGPIRS